MLNEKIRINLIKQLNRESESSQLYLNMASWADYKGFEGTCNFLYQHSDEERNHMIKLMKYINKRKGKAVLKNSNIFSIEKNNFCSLKNLFQEIFEHEKLISGEINFLVELSLKERDYFTYSFLQWYVKEQIKEEHMSKMILDKIELIGDDKIGLYIFDKDIKRII